MPVCYSCQKSLKLRRPEPSGGIRDGAVVRLRKDIWPDHSKKAKVHAGDEGFVTNVLTDDPLVAKRIYSEIYGL